MNAPSRTTGRYAVRKHGLNPAAWPGRLGKLAVAVVVGLILGQQIIDPQPRVLKAWVGLAVAYAAWKLPIPVSLAAFLILFPFPFATAYATSNTLFIFLITAMWLAQVVLKTTRPARRTLLDIPILCLLGAYLISFSSLDNALALSRALQNVFAIVAGMFAFYLIVNSVRDEATLRRMVRIVIVTSLLTFVVAIHELLLPGRPFIKGWILSSSVNYLRAIRHGMRVGGPFGDFELYAEYCALMFPLTLFELVRSRGLRSRMMWAGLLGLNFFVLMATVTRGATISLSLGMIYLLYRLRRTLTFRQLTIILTLTISAFVSLEFILANYTISGSVFQRLLATKFVGGLPDSRTFWPQIVARIQERPWFGHGPYYELGEFHREKLTRFFWPHNGYLFYLHTVGIFGTAAFLWILWRLWSSTNRGLVGSLTDRNYPRSLLLVWNVIITIFAIDQFKIEYLRNPSYQFFPWIVFGMTVATWNVYVAQNPAPIKVGAPGMRRRFRGQGQENARSPARKSGTTVVGPAF